MESKIAGYRLVPETDGCKGCFFYELGITKCPLCPYDKGNKDCFAYGAIYVPADTAIEVPKTNQQEK